MCKYSFVEKNHPPRPITSTIKIQVALAVLEATEVTIG